MLYCVAYVRQPRGSSMARPDPSPFPFFDGLPAHQRTEAIIPREGSVPLWSRSFSLTALSRAVLRPSGGVILKCCDSREQKRPCCVRQAASGCIAAYTQDPATTMVERVDLRVYLQFWERPPFPLLRRLSFTIHH